MALCVKGPGSARPTLQPCSSPHPTLPPSPYQPTNAMTTDPIKHNVHTHTLMAAPGGGDRADRDARPAGAAQRGAQEAGAEEGAGESVCLWCSGVGGGWVGGVVVGQVTCVRSCRGCVASDSPPLSHFPSVFIVMGAGHGGAAGKVGCAHIPSIVLLTPSVSLAVQDNVVRREKVAVLTRGTLADPEMLGANPDAVFLMSLAELPVPAAGAEGCRGGVWGAGAGLRLSAPGRPAGAGGRCGGVQGRA